MAEPVVYTTHIGHVLFKKLISFRDTEQNIGSALYHDIEAVTIPHETSRQIAVAYNYGSGNNRCLRPNFDCSHRNRLWVTRPYLNDRSAIVVMPNTVRVASPAAIAIGLEPSGKTDV